MLDLTPYHIEATSKWHRMRTETHSRKSWAVYRLGERVGTIVGFRPRSHSPKLTPAHYTAHTDVSQGTFARRQDAFAEIVKYCR